MMVLFDASNFIINFLKHNLMLLSPRCRYSLPALFEVLMRNMREIVIGLRSKKSKVTSSAAAALQNVPQIPHGRGVGAQKSRYLLLGQ